MKNKISKFDKLDKIEKSLEVRKKTVKKNKELFLEALKLTHGVVLAACRKLDIDKSMIYVWLKNDPDFKEEFDKVRDYVKDNLVELAESVVNNHLEKNSLKAAEIMIKYKGRLKGYGENLDITTGGEKLNIKFDFGVDKPDEPK